MNVKLPDFIAKLPKVKTVNSVTQGLLVQGELSQSVFFIMKAGEHIPAHAHAAQWGIIIEGEFEITIGDEKQVYKKGDTFFLPANVLHSAYCITDVISFNILDDKDYLLVK